MAVLYRTQATAAGGRTGTVQTSDGRLSVRLDTVKELGGGGGDGTNPEQLLAAGYSACFLASIKVAASREKIKVDEATAVTASVGLSPREDGIGFEFEIALTVSIPGMDPDAAGALVAAADLVCPYSQLARRGARVTLSAT